VCRSKVEDGVPLSLTAAGGRVTDTRRTIEVQELVNHAGIGMAQLKLFALCLLVLALDGYDTVVAAYVAPQIKAQWAMPPTQLSLLFGVGLLGLTFGSFFLGPVADRFGRKATLIGSVLLFSMTSLASAYAPSPDLLIMLRFVTGLGLGGAMPNVYTLTAEYTPARLRASLIAPVGCGVPVGGAIAGLFAAKVIHAYGWQAMFVIGGALPLLLVPALALWLPESVRFQIAKAKPQACIARTLRRMYASAEIEGARFALHERHPSGSPVAALVKHGRAGGTVLLWVTALGALLVVYFLSSWLPLLIQQGGATAQTGALMMSCYLFGNTLGAILLGVLMDRLNPQRVLCAAFLVGCCALASLGLLIGTPWLAFGALFVTGVGSGGTTTGTIILATAFYSTANRATGVSWTLAFGRVGSIIGSMSAGLLLAAKWTPAHIFIAAAAPLLIAAVAVAAHGRLRSVAHATAATPSR
jgi:MFS transporter, AAHS family, 4-hydroxybenzoate transporter